MNEPRGEFAGNNAPLAPGQELEGKYRVARQLGGGAMGLVYEGYHLRLEKAVAIKVLRPELASVEDLRERFEAEARAAAAIGHPNIVTVTDLGQTPNGALYFVMDRLRGESLGERLEREGKLDVAATVRITSQVLAGLEAAHALKLVHRDLKPDNIFLSKAPGGREIAKILDFGIAKALASVGKRKQGTRLGSTVGTPLYMSPEQAVASPDIDHRSDLYAMGVILYQMLAGRPPFEGAEPMAVLAAVMTTTPPPLRALCPQAPRALIDLIESAMSRERDHRPATAADFAARLEQTVSGVFTPAPVQVSTAINAAGLAALDSGALVDLAGDAVPPAAVVQARAPEDDLDGMADPELTPDPAPAHPAATYVIPFQERAPAADPATAAAARAARAVEGPRPTPRAVKAALWLVPAAALLAGAVMVGPRLLDRRTAEGTASAATTPAAAARETAVVRFEVYPTTSQLFLDGAPLASNPVTLGKGEVHTVTAAAPGHEMAVEKFFVDKATKTVLLKLPPRRR